MLVMDLMFRGAYEERVHDEELKVTIKECIELNNRHNAYVNSYTSDWSFLIYHVEDIKASNFALDWVNVLADLVRPFEGRKRVVLAYFGDRIAFDHQSRVYFGLEQFFAPLKHELYIHFSLWFVDDFFCWTIACSCVAQRVYRQLPEKCWAFADIKPSACIHLRHAWKIAMKGILSIERLNAPIAVNPWQRAVSFKWLVTKHGNAYLFIDW